MRMLKASLLIGLLIVLGLTAQAANFDACVNSLYSYGGLSKAEGRKNCLPGLSENILQCQKKEFLIDFKSPQEALDSCRSNSEDVDLERYSFYKGAYEKIPTADEKQTVCSITVNSSDEREAFRKNLDSKKFSWVELLPQNPVGSEGRFIPRDDFWLKRACEQKVRCDILVISGHFASTFLGSSGFEIKLEDLTKYSCQDQCNDFFNSIKQVYLFGCNTLSGREPDSRSIDQYRDILTVDGVSPHQAQRIAARRYTTYGNSIRDEIRQVFPKAQKIFGFSGPGPTGHAVSPFLNSFLKAAYADSLENWNDQDFRKTLGQTGMLEMKGLDKDQLSCHAEHNNIRDNELKSADGLAQYIKRFGRTLPVAVFDLVAEALQKKYITDVASSNLVKQTLSLFQNMSLHEQRRLLCPLAVTEHATQVPQNLQCVADNSWL